MFDFILACPGAFTLGQMLAISTAVSAAGTAIQYMGAKQKAKEQEEYQEHLASLQKEAGQRKASALIARNIQDREAAARQRFAVSQEGEKAKAMGVLSAAEGGVAGLSIDHIISEYDQQQAQYIHGIAQEQVMRERETNRLLKDVQLGTAQQMASTRAPVREPNAFAAALEWGAGSVGTAVKYGYYKGGTKDPNK
jgi:hypothetical protein